MGPIESPKSIGRLTFSGTHIFLCFGQLGTCAGEHLPKSSKICIHWHTWRIPLKGWRTWLDVDMILSLAGPCTGWHDDTPRCSAIRKFNLPPPTGRFVRWFLLLVDGAMSCSFLGGYEPQHSPKVGSGSGQAIMAEAIRVALQVPWEYSDLFKAFHYIRGVTRFLLLTVRPWKRIATWVCA